MRVEQQNDVLYRQHFETVKNNQAFIGETWDLVKNIFGMETGSEYIETQLNAFENGEISVEEIARLLKEYNDGQEEAVDITANVASGSVAALCYLLAIVSAPHTLGSSVPTGITLAVTSGATVKASIKRLDAMAKRQDYNFDDFRDDIIEGGALGALAPFTGGVAGSVTKPVATRMGVSVFSRAGRFASENGLKVELKKILLHPTGYKYSCDSNFKTSVSYVIEVFFGGTIGGVKCLIKDWLE